MTADRTSPAKAPPRSADPARGEVDERDVLRAALRVFRHLETEAQLDKMAATVAGWCGASAAFALSPGGEGGALHLRSGDPSPR